MTASSPSGLCQLERGSLTRIAVLYAVLTMLVLTIPALVMQPRDEPPHPTNNRSVGSTAPWRR